MKKPSPPNLVHEKSDPKLPDPPPTIVLIETVARSSPQNRTYVITKVRPPILKSEDQP